MGIPKLQITYQRRSAGDYVWPKNRLSGTDAAMKMAIADQMLSWNQVQPAICDFAHAPTKAYPLMMTPYVCLLLIFDTIKSM